MSSSTLTDLMRPAALQDRLTSYKALGGKPTPNFHGRSPIPAQGVVLHAPGGRRGHGSRGSADGAEMIGIKDCWTMRPIPS